jgi:hypothetical protein
LTTHKAVKPLDLSRGFTFSGVEEHEAHFLR